MTGHYVIMAIIANMAIVVRWFMAIHMSKARVLQMQNNYEDGNGITFSFKNNILCIFSKTFYNLKRVGPLKF